MSLKRTAIVVIALASVLFPRRVLRVNVRLNLFGYENTGDVRPKRWLVRFTRVAGLLVFFTEIRHLGDEPGEIESNTETR